MPKQRLVSRRVLLAIGSLLLTATCRDNPAPTSTSEPERPFSPSFEVTSSNAAVLVGAGDIASCSTTRDDETATLLDGIPGTVFTAGDNAYTSGSATNFSSCYDPTWGRHKARTRPAPGERDYSTSGAAGYFGYFGAAAGDSATGYYSYDLGDWHVVVLNSSRSMSAGSAQVVWLKADLKVSTAQCTVAYWHGPRFSSTGSSGVSSTSKPMWDVLYKAGAEIVVNSHYRFYERFAPQNPDGAADQAHGLREFIVGTGGAGTTSFGSIRPNSEVRNTGSYGVLKLTLDASAYAWEFIPVPGKTFTDAGSGACHGPPPPIAKPGGPYTAEAVVTFDGSASSDPQGETPLSYAWAFGDDASGTGAKPSHTYSADGVYTVTLVVTDTLGNASAPATTTVTIANVAPVVRAGPDARTHPGETVTLSMYFTDLGPDAPWEYTITWGDGWEESAVTNTAGLVTLTHSYAALGGYVAHATVTDKDGGTGADTLTVLVREPGTAEVFVGAGDISACSNNRDDLTAQLLDGIEGTVFTIGDNVYPNGRTSDYQNCYAPTWGRHRDRTYAVLGNHDYDTGNADASFDYYASGVGPRGKGYYSFNLGDWHIIVINDNLSFSSGSSQDQWLQSDLAANTKQCTLALWHQPRFYSSTSSSTVSSSRRILWDRLYAAGAEIVLNGHRHQYERFAPMAPGGVLDASSGIRQFIAGTGGEGTVNPSVVAANREVMSSAFGILKLTLSPGAYTWEFVPMAGETFTDSGSATCH